MRLHHGWSVQSIIYDNGLRHITFSHATRPVISDTRLGAPKFRTKAGHSISVTFHANDLSAFQPVVRIKPASKRLPSK